MSFMLQRNTIGNLIAVAVIGIPHFVRRFQKQPCLPLIRIVTAIPAIPTSSLTQSYLLVTHNCAQNTQIFSPEAAEPDPRKKNATTSEKLQQCYFDLSFLLQCARCHAD